MGVDSACLSDYAGNSTCATEFNFFVFNHSTGLGSADGILGFGPPYAANGPSFIQALIDQGQLVEPIVSF